MRKAQRGGRPWWGRGAGPCGWDPRQAVGGGRFGSRCSGDFSIPPCPEAPPSPPRPGAPAFLPARGAAESSPGSPGARPEAYVTRVALCTPGEPEAGVVSGYFHPLVLTALLVRSRRQWRVFLTPAGGGREECRAQRGLCSRMPPTPRAGGQPGNPWGLPGPRSHKAGRSSCPGQAQFMPCPPSSLVTTTRVPRRSASPERPCTGAGTGAGTGLAPSGRAPGPRSPGPGPGLTAEPPLRPGWGPESQARSSKAAFKVGRAEGTEDRCVQGPWRGPGPPKSCSSPHSTPREAWPARTLAQTPGPCCTLVTPEDGHRWASVPWALYGPGPLPAPGQSPRPHSGS